MKNLVLYIINHFFPSFLFRIKKNKIVMDSFLGREYSGNAKYITDELLNMSSNLDIVWLALKGNTPGVYPDGVRVVKYNSLRSVYELATAKVWVDDFRKKYFPPKKKKQKYIQVWHGSVTLKHVEKDIEKNLGKVYLTEAKRDGASSDFMISGNAVSTKLYTEKFWFSGQIMEYGTPRLDSIINYNGRYLNVWDKIDGIKKSDHVILYAPTFRDDVQASEDIYRLPFNSIKKTLIEKFGGDWKILVRLHPNLAHLENEIIQDSSVIGVSRFSDSQALILRSDIVITDYSSIMFDAMYADKPVFLYVPDLVEYTDNRGMYFSISDLPFAMAEKFNDLLKNIQKFEKNANRKKVQLFREAIGSVEKGNASLKTARLILNLLKDSDYNG